MCDDGLAAWNYFDAALEAMMKSPDAAGRLLPLARITAPVTATTRIVP
jgi:hypothetical protein